MTRLIRTGLLMLWLAGLALWAAPLLLARAQSQRGQGTQPPRPMPLVLTPVIALPRGVDPARLAVHSFTTATVDAAGKVSRFAGTPAQQYSEDLGNGVRLEMVAVKGAGNLRDFWIGKFEVTQAQWKAVRGANNNPSRFTGDDALPVENVCWGGSDCPEQYSVEGFCNRLNSKLGLNKETGYRLLKEAEWEYAARAGTKTEFAFGDTISPEIVNYDGNYPYGNAQKGIYREKTVPVGSLGVANAWGIFDMHGNVFEWCEDIYQAVAPSRVARGGGWFSIAVICRPAYRSIVAPGIHSGNLGFRLSRTAR
jgi:eukaryotic-like serine/threonine-protein kinase